MGVGVRENEGEWSWQTYTADALLRAGGPKPQPIGRQALRDMASAEQSVTLVWKRVAGQGERPWAFVAPSAALRLAGVNVIGDDESMGLYAWRSFKRDETIGWYGTRASH